MASSRSPISFAFGSSTPAAPRFADARDTHASTCARSFRQRFTASCAADTPSRTRTSNSNCASKSACVAGVRGSASNSNDRACSSPPTESATR